MQQMVCETDRQPHACATVQREVVHRDTHQTPSLMLHATRLPSHQTKRKQTTPVLLPKSCARQRDIHPTTTPISPFHARFFFFYASMRVVAFRSPATDIITSVFHLPPWPPCFLNYSWADMEDDDKRNKYTCACERELVSLVCGRSCALCCLN